MKKCPNCYAHLPNDLESCPMCGTSVKDAEILPDDASSDNSAKRFCPFCGKEQPAAGAAYCSFCGKPLNSNNRPQTPPSYHYTPPAAQQAPARKVCPKCGIAYYNRDICPDCGLRLIDSDHSPSHTAPISSDYDSPSANGCLIVIAFLVPLIGFIIAAVSYNNSNQKAGRSYLKAAIAGVIVNVVLIILLAACGIFSGNYHYHYYY